MTLAVAAALALLAPFAAAPLAWKPQALLGAGFMLFAVIANRLSNARGITYLLMFVSLLCTVRYAYWRGTQTLGIGVSGYAWYDYVVTWLLFLAEVYAWIVLILGFIQTARPLRRKPVPMPGNVAQWPSVDVFVPTYNEPLEVVRATLLAALQIDWPADKLSVYLLDDGVRREFEAFAVEIGVGYITRAEHAHAKAGNLNHAMTKTDGEYIAVFDCDHIPTRAFLQTTMGLFLHDSRLALIQTPHHFYSPDPFERNLNVFKEVPSEDELFYGVIQDGNDLWNASFFCGSCAVLRRSALDDVGGIATQTVTEDSHTSLKLHARGWRSAYLKIPLAAGLATESFSSHVGQRIRWARGMAQIMRIDNPLFKRGLTLAQRLCYLNAMLHFFFALPRLIFLVAPLAYLFFGIYVINAYALAIAAYAIPHLAVAMVVNSRVQGRYRHSFWNEVYETALAPYILLPTLFAILSRKLGKFNVTAKGGLVPRDYFDRAMAKPFAALFLLNMAGLIAAAVRWSYSPHAAWATLAMTSAWTLYNLLMICVVLGANWETRQVRLRVRLPICLPATLYCGDSTVIRGETVDISEGGVRVTSAPFPPGATPVRVGIFMDRKEALFPVELVRAMDDRVQLRFGELDNRQFAALVRIMYGRADAWLSREGAREPDRIGRSLAEISRLSAEGFARFLFGAWRRPSPPAAADDAPLATDAARPADSAGPAKSAQRPIPLHVWRGARTRLALIALTVLGLLASFSVAHAGAKPPTPGFSDHYTLTRLGAHGALGIRGTPDVKRISLPLPPTQVVAHSTMQLHYVLAATIPKQVTALDVIVNNQLVKSIPVTDSPDKGQPHTLSFRIPAALWGPHNHIGFRLKASSPLVCRAVSSSPAWAHILPRTRIDLSGERIHTHNNLTLLPAPFFYPGMPTTLRLSFVMPGPSQPERLQAAGIVASWFGALAGFRGADFPVHTSHLPKRGNAVVIATPTTMPVSGNAPSITGPGIAITANPNDPNGKLLWILGQNPAQLVQAARALVLHPGTFTGATARVGSVALPPPAPPDHNPRWVSTNKPVALHTLADTKPMRTAGAGSLPFTLHLPPSLFFWHAAGPALSLDYGYGNDRHTRHAALTLALNKHFLKSLPMPRPGRRRTTTVHLPGGDLHPYANALTASFSFRRAQPGCTRTGGHRPIGVIGSDSSLDLSGIPLYVREPELGLWANGGYPYTRHGELSRTAFVLDKTPTRGQIRTYLDLMGRFGQFTGEPGVRVAVATPAQLKTVAGRDLIVLGPPDGAGLRRVAKNLPLTAAGRLAATGSIAGRLGRDVSELRQKLPWLTGPDHRHGRAALRRGLAKTTSTPAIIEAGISPLHARRMLLAISAATPQAWRAVDSVLDTEAANRHIFGDVSLIRDTSAHSYVLDMPRYHLGSLPPWTWALYRLYQHPWIILLGGIVAAAVLALILNLLLRRIARRRLSQSS